MVKVIIFLVKIIQSDKHYSTECHHHFYLHYESKLFEKKNLTNNNNNNQHSNFGNVLNDVPILNLFILNWFRTYI